MPSIPAHAFERLVEDRDRLDWLQAHLTPQISEALWAISDGRMSMKGTLRDRIDAVMELPPLEGE